MPYEQVTLSTQDIKWGITCQDLLSKTIGYHPDFPNLYIVCYHDRYGQGHIEFSLNNNKSFIVHKKEHYMFLGKETINFNISLSEERYPNRRPSQWEANKTWCVVQ